MSVMYRNALTHRAMGGTEILASTLESRIAPEILDKFQIWCSRVDPTQVDSTKIQVLYLHDLPGDPAAEHLAAGGYNKFDRLIFVSNWQMQGFIARYGIPWHKCVVVENAIDPIANTDKPADITKLIYHTTPHRGLEILVPVFEQLCNIHPNIELDVFSSFKIYGWEERDQQYEQLFERCKQHPKINYFGSVPHAEVREAVAKAHIFAYPSIWMETSCMCLMEAMSAGCVCVHPNFGALYETAGGMTLMYQYHADKRDHAQMLLAYLDHAIKHHGDIAFRHSLGAQQAYANSRYNWELKLPQWEHLLREIASSRGL